MVKKMQNSGLEIVAGLTLPLNADFPSQFCTFYCKITFCYSKIGFLRKCFSKEQKPVAFILSELLAQLIILLWLKTNSGF